jgi:hypothetical protein
MRSSTADLVCCRKTVEFDSSGHHFVLTIDISGGTVDTSTWQSFFTNGGDPNGFDPNAASFGVDFKFSSLDPVATTTASAVLPDPMMSFTLSEDGTPLSFRLAPTAVPEPGTLGLTLVSLAGLGLFWRRKVRHQAAAI